MFCGDHLLAAKLRRANIDASAGAVEEIARIVASIRERWPRVRILPRADSGFARSFNNTGTDRIPTTPTKAQRTRMPNPGKSLIRRVRQPFPE